MVNTYELPNMSGGMDGALIGVVSAVPVFTPMLLLFVYLTILIGGSISQKKRSGFSDIPLWSVIASISTLMVSLAMALTTGIINPVILGIIVTITIASGLWLFLDTNRNEAFA